MDPTLNTGAANKILTVDPPALSLQKGYELFHEADVALEVRRYQPW